MSSNTVLSLNDNAIHVVNNGELLISLGRSRFETSWKNKTMLWSVLLSKL